MYTAVNAWTLSDARSGDDYVRLAAEAGFAGVELVIGQDGPLQLDTPASAFADLGQRAADVDVQLSGLATGVFFQYNYASPDATDRQRAHDLTLHMLDQAAAGRIEAILVVPAVVGKATAPVPSVPYADAYHRTLDALSSLRFEAEARGVTIAIENVWNRFLLSPLEAADLLDEINSPHVAFYFDTGNILPFGYPQDWIDTLGGRIARVHAKDYDVTRPGRDGFCELGAGSVDWPAVIHALRRFGYDGPLTYEGGGEPVEACRRLRNILVDRPPLETEETS